MQMEVPLRMLLTVYGLLVEAHGVREGGLKDLVVGGGKLLQYARQASMLQLIQICDIGNMSLRNDESLKRPHCPKRHKDDKGIVF